MKPLLSKVTFICRPMSGNDNKSVIFPFFHLILSSGDIEISFDFFGSFSLIVIQGFCAKSENLEKKIFQKKLPITFFWTRRLRFSTLPKVTDLN